MVGFGDDRSFGDCLAAVWTGLEAIVDGASETELEGISAVGIPASILVFLPVASWLDVMRSAGDKDSLRRHSGCPHWEIGE